MVHLSGQRVLLLLSLACAGIVAVWVDSRPVDRTASVTRPAQVKAARAQVREAAPAAVPDVELDRLTRPAAQAPGGNPFPSQGWTAPRAQAAPVRAAEVPPERAPPLPFTFLGRWTERDHEVVLLGSQGRNHIARAGEVLDGVYRIDRIEAGRVLLTYLPLDEPQVLVFDRAPAADPAPGARVRVAALPRGAENAGALLRVVMPARVGVAEEFTIILRLHPRQAADVERGSVEVVYDPKVLSASVAGGARTPSTGARQDPGHVAVELGRGRAGHAEAPTALRMRVVAQAATTTQIALAAPNASDAEGAPLAVAVDGSNPRTLVIGPSPKTGDAPRTEPRPPH